MSMDPGMVDGGDMGMMGGDMGPMMDGHFPPDQPMDQ